MRNTYVNLRNYNDKCTSKENFTTTPTPNVVRKIDLGGTYGKTYSVIGKAGKLMGIELYFVRDLNLCKPVPYQSKILIPPCDRYNYKIEIKSKEGKLKYTVQGGIPRNGSIIRNSTNPDPSKEENKIDFIINYQEQDAYPYRSIPDNIYVLATDTITVTVTCIDNCSILMPNLKNTYGSCYNCDTRNSQLFKLKTVVSI